MSLFAPLFRFMTYPADAMRVVFGANEGDPMAPGAGAEAGDIYRLSRTAKAQRLAICYGPQGGQRVAQTSKVGRPGDTLSIIACHTLMGPRGELIDILMLMRHGDEDSSVHLLPLSPLMDRVEYEMISSNTPDAPKRFFDVASVSFLQGTHLTLADGSQRAVEDLQQGDRLLTRNHGPQPIRWIERQTRRATGAAAPIRISKGTMNTVRDLRLSPQHRLLIWQRRDELGTGRAEVMVKADLLVNGTSVVREEGGHVDSYQLVLNGHEIIYAEGIAVESLLVPIGTMPQLPDDLILDPMAPDDLAGMDADEASLDPSGDFAERLARASRGDDA